MSAKRRRGRDRNVLREKGTKAAVKAVAREGGVILHDLYTSNSTDYPGVPRGTWR